VNSIIMFNKIGCWTAARLSRMLKIPKTRRLHKKRYRTCINWGVAVPEEFNGIKFDKIFNHPDNVKICLTKDKCHEIFERANVRTPRIYKDADQIRRFPVIVRKRSHHGGNGLAICRNINEAKAAFFNLSPAYSIDLIESTKEFRVHVINGAAVRVQIKRADNDRAHKIIRSGIKGWTLVGCANGMKNEVLKDIAVRAVKSLNLDFGGVDIIKGTNNKYYVLEVNTAPSLGDYTIGLYVEEMRKII
jgi:carbamoylphosphate synthase large subunit